MLLAAIAATVGLLVLQSGRAQGQHGPAPFAPGRVLVKFKDGSANADRVAALAAVNARGAHRLGELDVQSVDVAPGDELAAVAHLRGHGAVEFAEPDMLVHAGSIASNDPGFANQWYLSNVSAPQAWNTTTGSSNIVVAILDTGCEPTNPDLMPNYITGWNFYNNSSNTSDPNGHGTAVAGCVGARGGNGIGIASVSWNSRIMPVVIADPTAYAYWSTVATGMQWAVDHGARIENCSYVGLAGSSTILSAAQYVYSRGGMFVACAGNDAVNPGFAASPYIIIASGTNSSNTLASFSDYGAFVTVCAPATSIYTTDISSYGYYSTWEGTSFAAPITAGVLALEFAVNPNLTPDQARSVLINSVDDLGAAGWDQYFGYGKVNAYKAAQLAATVTAAPPPVVTVTSPGTGATVSGSATITTSATSGSTITQVQVMVDGTTVATLTASPYNANWNTSQFANGSHTVSAKATDSTGKSATSANVTVTVSNTVDTTPPTCAILSPISGVRETGPFSIKVQGSDNVGVVSLTLYLDGKQVASASGASYSFSLNAKKWASGAHTVSAVAADSAGNKSVPASITVYR